MRNGAIECFAKRLVLAAFVVAAVVCGGSKHPQTVGAIALNAPQTDAGRPDPSRWNAMVGYPPSEASPQSGCPSRGAIALNRPNAPQTVAAEDIARGYRFVGEATEDIVYTMPEDGVEVGNWGKRGTFGEWMRYELGWAFPLGSNNTSYSAFAVFNDGKIRPTPRDRSHEICAVGVPMLAMQGRSQFWVADGSGGETTLTWENFYLNADTNAPINAQIVLCANGDFVTRSNEVARYYTRIDPNDWDGDGLANEVDGEPYTSDGDCFGTGEGWWAANALAVAATNANPNAYYWLEFAATKDRTRVAVTCDGASDLGDMVVIARTNQVCRVPLLIGATYAVRATAPLTGIVTSDENANITFNDNIQVSAARTKAAPSLSNAPGRDDPRPSETMGRVEGNRPYHAVAWGRASADFDVCSPLEFVIENYDDGRYGLVVSPSDPGVALLGVTGGCCTNVVSTNGFRWVCTADCGCGAGEHALYATVAWEGYERLVAWTGSCPCLEEEESARTEIESRGVTLELLDEGGGAIAWKDPVLVGEGLTIRVVVGGGALSRQDFASLFRKRLRLRAYSVDADGSHTIADKPPPLNLEDISEVSSNVFRVAVSAEWLEANRLASNTEDGRFAKTSIDMSKATSGDSQRTDSDIFDANVGGFLHGRARGKDGGSEAATIPEGEFNLRTVRAAGTASLVACVGDAQSSPKQVQQQADILYYSGHGTHDTGVLNGVAGAEDVAGYWRHVETVVFAGCAVLDIDDVENNFASEPLRHAASPGRKWVKSSNANVMLGYAYYAPKDKKGGIAIARDWCRLRTSLGDVEAWMQANDCRTGHNACAIRKRSGSAIEYQYFKRTIRKWRTNKYERATIEKEVSL